MFPGNLRQVEESPSPVHLIICQLRQRGFTQTLLSFGLGNATSEISKRPGTSPRKVVNQSPLQHDHSDHLIEQLGKETTSYARSLKHCPCLKRCVLES